MTQQRQTSDGATHLCPGSWGSWPHCKRPRPSFTAQAGIFPGPPFFADLRHNSWQPRFHWEYTTGQTADRINLPHEDYPRRVGDTERALIMAMNRNQNHLQERGRILPITLELLREVHCTIFPDHGQQAGQWRRLDVRVADHLAPSHQLMDGLMRQLEQHYLERELRLQDLRHWYFDFETIHPFRDGNGRVGGVIIAALSFPAGGKFLTPGQ